MTAKNSRKVLLIAPVMEQLQQRLEAAFVVHKLYEQADPAAYLAQNGADIAAVVTRGDTGVSTQVLEALPSAGLVAIFGVGTDAVDLGYTRRRGIDVTITSGALTEDVADMALGLLLSTSRLLCQGDRFVRQGRWLREAPPLSTQVSGKRIGIFGMGNIGQAIARRAAGFDMQVRYTDRKRNDALPYDFHPDLPALAGDSDFLVVAASGGKESQGWVNRAIFDALPSHALVINIARGSIVNEPDLINALQQGDIAGAGLDVYADEPNVPQALLEMENVVLQPHTASATWETRRKMSDIVFDNVEAFFAARPLPNKLE
ncbi:2-hydroxyacid dehydrogenase [Acerihabitans sp. KWT182]|uniref:2-hydroxyacid dehydrogenase n=1 Tax=Acerihabitans sp. KWT182 TaxID=3157919 RepID=A0AAU7QDI0_9GAMM